MLAVMLVDKTVVDLVEKLVALLAAEMVDWMAS